MANKRIYYAVEAVGIAPFGSTSYVPVYGLQSVGINTRFNLEQVFEVGQLSIYQNVEGIPDIEITMEKALDGKPLIYHMLTQGAPDASLAGRSNQRAMLALSLFNDAQQASSGNPISMCTMSGVYVSAVTYDIRTDGYARESCTAVGNNKVWALNPVGSGTFTGGFSGTDAPLAPEGVNMRQHLLMASSIFPLDIPGISGDGHNYLQTDGNFAVHFGGLRVTSNFGRDQILELGRKEPFFRYINFPVEVRCDIDVEAIQGDMVQATEAGILGNGNNLYTSHIYFQMTEGLKIDLGIKNRLASVNYGGANAGARGGNARITYSYSTFNDLWVTHPQDPTVALRA